MGTPSTWWQRIEIGECFTWLGATNHLGYGHARVPGDSKRVQMAHRLVWEQTVGPIPKKMEVDHHCLNRGCVNVDHMELVTHQENQLRRWTPSRRENFKTP